MRIEFLKRYFIKLGLVAPDPEITVQDVIEQLGQCRPYVALASSKYDDGRYKCEITVRARDLYRWAENHSRRCFHSRADLQTALLALPLWLRAASTAGSEVSYLSDSMYEVVQPYITNFINAKEATIACAQCKVISNSVRKVLDNENSENLSSSWDERWFCSNGHLLYEEFHDIQLIVGD